DLQPLALVLRGVAVLRVAPTARVDKLVLVGYRASRAKYAAAFFRNSFSMRSSRSSRSASRSRARSLTFSGGLAFGQSGPLAPIQRRLVIRVLHPIPIDPVTQGPLIDSKFAGDLSDRPRSLDH